MRTTLAPFAAALLVVIGLALAVGHASAQVPGQLYTQHNLWYENPMRMYSTNYQRGTIIPAGTPVLALSKTDRHASFTDATTGVAHRIEFVRRHHPGKTAEQIWSRIFGVQPREALLAGLNPVELQGIQAGVVSAGMSKRAVLIAVGTPPESRTPSILTPQWRYWRSKTNSYMVNFVGDRVASLTE